MTEMTTLVLPALEIPSRSIDTGAGRLVQPGQSIPEKRIAIDPDLIRRCVESARAAASRAYAPFSDFHVGAALVMADDPALEIRTGANVENSSFGASICAERTGLFAAVAAGFRQLKYLAVSTTDAIDRPLGERSPCGICRQAIREFADASIGSEDALILIDTGDPEVLCEVFDIDRLLPFGFQFGHR